VVMELLILTPKENSSFMRLCHLEVSMEEECLNSVWLSLKAQVGMLLITALLNLTSMVKDKVVTSSMTNAAAAQQPLMSSAQEAAEDVLPMEELVVNVAVTLRPMDANTMILKSIGIVTMMMVKIMLDSQVLKSTEEGLVASASLVI